MNRDASLGIGWHTIGFAILFLAACGGAAPVAAPEAPEGPLVATASSGQDDYVASNAMDGNFSTRWGSGFGDNEWIAFDLGKKKELAGIVIHWETAYGRDYDVQVSDDGASWRTVAEVREGDGGKDEILFRPLTTRHLKIQGIKRGTGWGYSIFEVDLLGPGDIPVATATSSAPGRGAEFIFDGDLATSWRSADASAVAVTIDLKRVREVGGLTILWGEAFPAAYTISASENGENWIELDRVDQTDGGRDLLFFPQRHTRWLKIDAPAGPVEIADIVIASGDRDVSLERIYESHASRLPDGVLPRWLKRVQTFWTITGVPDDPEETLLGEDGSVEPVKDGFSIRPLLAVDGAAAGGQAVPPAPGMAPSGGAIWSPDEMASEHLLAEGALPLPTARFERDGILFEVTAVGHGEKGSSATTVRYRLANRGTTPRTVSLTLAVWPLQLNPPWQYGGAAPIRKASITANELRLNDRAAAWPLMAPQRLAVGGPELGHPFAWTRTGLFPETRAAEHSAGAITAAMAWDLALPPDGAEEIVVVYPLHAATRRPPAGDGKTFFARLFDAESARWRKRLGDWTLEAPDTRLVDIMRANLAYMILNRDYSAAQPGPRNYAKAWMRDGAVSTSTYLHFGFVDIARDYLRWFSRLVGPDGFAPFLVSSKTGEPPGWAADWKEYDSQGQYAYAVRRLFDHTGDRALLASLYPSVVRAMNYMIARLEERRIDRYKGTEYFGILPESNSHEGYFPGVHSYWDDFWGLRGLADAADLAEILGKTADASRFRAEEKRFRADLYASFKKVMDRSGIDWLAGCAEKADFDPTSTSIALVACGELDHLRSDERISRALDRTFQKYVEGLIPRYDGSVWGGYTPYEARNVEALVRLGRAAEARKLMDFFIDPGMRPPGWKHLGEVVHYDRRTGSYIGDMPHTWVGADMINAIRSFFLIDDGSTYELARGVPAEWLADGRHVSVGRWHTPSGIVSWTLKRDGAKLVCQVEGSAKPREGWILHNPLAAATRSIEVNGKAVEVGSPIRFATLPATVTIVTEE
jgi:hypothetical protein